MKLIEFDKNILQGLKERGYKYFIHTTPTVEEEQTLQCCEVGLVKYIPLKTIEEVEDYEQTFGESYHIDLDEVCDELEDAADGIDGVKFFISEEYVLS